MLSSPILSLGQCNVVTKLYSPYKGDQAFSSNIVPSRTLTRSKGGSMVSKKQNLTSRVLHLSSVFAAHIST